MKIIKRTLIALGTLIVMLVFICLLMTALRQDDWKKRTTPLPRDTITVLCTNFQLENDDPLCSGKKDVYGPDFYNLLRDTFRPFEEYEIDSSEAATYEDVEEKIGMFKYECDDVATTGDGFAFYSCRYDLRGDREFIIGIMYTSPDNAVFRINTPMGYDGEQFLREEKDRHAV